MGEKINRKMKKVTRKEKPHKIKGEVPLNVRKDFEIYARGVERLKELERELNSLDTRGYYKEEQSIRARLKNVSDIPIIEKQLKKLRLKINKKYVKPARNKSSNKITKTDIIEIKAELPKIEKRIAELSAKKAMNVSCADEKEIKEIKSELPKIEKSIYELLKRDRNKVTKEDLEGVKARFPVLEKRIDQLSRRTTGRQSSKDIKDIKEELPRIESGIEELSKKVKEIDRKKKLKVDPDVGILVESNFTSFLNDIKTSLSKRIEGKEKELDDVLKADLQEREEKFREKYLDLIRDFNDKKRKIEGDFEKKYKKRVSTSLKKEVSEKFNRKLHQKLNVQKVQLSTKYKSLLREHAEQKLRQEENSLRRRFEEEEEGLNSRFEKDEEKLKKNFLDEFNKRIDKANAKINAEKRRLSAEREEVSSKKELLEREREKIKQRLMNEFQAKLHAAVNEKEKALRQQIGAEYNLKMKKELTEYEEELRSKKLELELQVQKKMKEILK